MRSVLAALALTASPALASTFHVVNQSGQTVCLSSDSAYVNQTTGLQYRNSQGWACVADGQTSSTLTYSGIAYVVAIANGADYVTAHQFLPVQQAVVFGNVEKSFQLEYYYDQQGAVHWHYELNGANFSALQTAAATAAESADQVFVAQISPYGFVTADAWIVDHAQLGDDYTLTLTP